ncbi:MAG TPA: toxic anion resistance protein [Candidatus Polarisedimenticolaceae bacterium]|nr:toxic anion resistance protein [Candidatus Polarisedimenticolaceae bacterium]
MKNSTVRRRPAAAIQPLSPAERKKAFELFGRYDPADPESVLKFGTSVQAQVSKFQDRVMSHVQAKDNRRVIDLLDRLLGRLRALEMTPNGRPSILRKLRAFRSRLSWTEQCMADYHELGQTLERQIDELNDARGQLLAEVAVFEKLYEQNLVLLRNVGLGLRVLDWTVNGLREKLLPRVRRKLRGSHDPEWTLELQDVTDRIDRLERRARDLALTREICVQSARQIRLSQHDRQMLAERILDAVLNAIPLWKTQVSIALIQSRQRETMKLYQRIMRATDQALDRNRSILDQGRLDASRGTRGSLRGTRRGPLAVEPDVRPDRAPAPAAPSATVPPAPMKTMKPAGGLEH